MNALKIVEVARFCGRNFLRQIFFSTPTKGFVQEGMYCTIWPRQFSEPFVTVGQKKSRTAFPLARTLLEKSFPRTLPCELLLRTLLRTTVFCLTP